jgi:hypothetical protein
MASLEPLAPDQRAVVSLLLQQGRSYDEIAALLGIAPEAVRSRAHAGLAALAPEHGLPDEITGLLADYLLGQQPPRDAEATHGLLVESAPARGWASGVAARLAGVAPAPLPDVPAGRDGPVAAAGAGPPAGPARAVEPPAAGEPVAVHQPVAADEPAEEAGVAAQPVPAAAEEPDRPAGPAAAPVPAPRSSRLGGALLIAGVLAVLAVVLFLVLRDGGDEDADPVAEATATATATATPTPAAGQAQVADDIALRPPGGNGDAQGVMTVYLQDGALQFALQAAGLPDASANPYVAVWLQKGDTYRRLGFANAAEDGTLAAGGPSADLADAFPQLFATYDRVIVSQETTDATDEPTRVVLAGKLPSGRG